MKKLLIIYFFLFSWSCKTNIKTDDKHIEDLAKDFMKASVIPKMKDPKPYEIVDAKVVRKTVADNINDYRFVYEHFSFNHFDSVANKRRLDSLIEVSKSLDSIISITVNVGYRTRYKRGDIVLDSIKLGYDSVKDKISYWPF
jgi:hypothetical protein